MLTVRDLDQSVAFYTDVIGLIVSRRSDDTVWLRGIEEASHHSLVLRATDGAAFCEQIGFRVLEDSDIDKAEAYLGGLGLSVERPTVAHQGPTLQFIDPLGHHIELTSSMDVVERKYQDFHEHRSGQPQRLDHFQVVTHDVQGATDFYADLGFRLAEYTAKDGTDELWGSWTEVKGNTHDFVFTNGRGPRMHHFAYCVPDVSTLMHAADVAGSLGHGEQIDRGPGRHGISNAVFLYLRDPDGHRIELFTSHYQVIDLETPPLRWDVSDPRRSQLWGMPASNRWFFEASEYPDQPVLEPLLSATPATLENYLAIH
ncbi:3,4-dihydroxyphenylacetate 2,3-dioxygenase [Microbacterium sp. A8/3-1]|uniref:3,4-dihydroxyphenylacetate 2,3-dioxygenase n=1 Tax=Microbacterium sp. A8/3-1 TaxID=3160749 RepID=A0AAU7VX91_9MICO